MICFRNVNKFYETKNLKYRALYDISFDINEGDYFVICGNSGCGKTTLLNLIGCIDYINDGEYIFKNLNISNLKNSHLCKLRNEEFSFIFDYNSLIPELNLIENIEIPMIYSSISKKIRREKVIAYLKMIGLYKERYCYINELSKEQKQKLCIGRAIINNRKIILVDEPRKFLQGYVYNELLEILSNLNKEGYTIIVSGKDPKDFPCGNKFLTLNDGKIS